MMLSLPLLPRVLSPCTAHTHRSRAAIPCTPPPAPLSSPSALLQGACTAAPCVLPTHRGTSRSFCVCQAQPAQGQDSKAAEEQASPQPPKQLGVPGLIPEGVKLEVKQEQEDSSIEWDPDTQTLRFPSIIGGPEPGARRSKLVIFTCDKCGARTARNVNPVAWERGFVMGQCANCEVWHVLASNDPKVFEEVPLSDKGAQAVSGSGGAAAAAAAAAAATAAATGAESSDAEGSDPAATASMMTLGTLDSDIEDELDAEAAGEGGCEEECELPW